MMLSAGQKAVDCIDVDPIYIRPRVVTRDLALSYGDIVGEHACNGVMIACQLLRCSWRVSAGAICSPFLFCECNVRLAQGDTREGLTHL